MGATQAFRPVKKMVLAYTFSTSTYYKSAALYPKISNAFSYWHSADPRSTNWYNQQIGSPQRVGVLLILMRAGAQQLPQALEQNLLARMVSIGGSPTNMVLREQAQIKLTLQPIGCIADV